MIHVFIINHFAGSSEMARNLRNYLSHKKGLQYFVFNTIHSGFEKEIVKKVRRYFEDEKLRFYCCGGSGTMRNMLNGFDNLSDVEVAFYPCGLTNDFLKCFGNDEDKFRNIDNLIEGKVVPIDYIKTNCGVALNTFSVGFDSSIVEYTDKYRIYDIFGSQMPYRLGVFKGVLFCKPKEIELSIDGKVLDKRFSEIIFGNGCVLGGSLYFSEFTDITDGLGSYFTVADVKTFESLNIVTTLMKKKLSLFKDNVSYSTCKSIEIRSTNNKPLLINYDGELVECGTMCKAEIVQKGLNFVIPQDIDVKEFRLEDA